MEGNLQHEDLLIKLRAKLNESKIKLWEPPFMQADCEVSSDLQDLAKKYATELLVPEHLVLEALRELQLHSIDRLKANAEFKETGLATLRVKASLPNEKPLTLKIQKRLESMGSELIGAVAEILNVTDNRIKLIFNGRVIKPDASLEQQELKNGVQLMALVMAESPEEVIKEDSRYLEMKATREDAQLLSESVDELGFEEDYMHLEDQSGKAVVLPPAERRSLLVGLALHQRARTAAHAKDYALALVLLLEADRQFSMCSSSLLSSVDNWAVLQLDVAWCYLCLRNLASAGDAARRLRHAQEAFTRTYGENHQRLIALKGTAANERVLIMRLYLMQGIVAYHQNKREEAKRLLDMAESELNILRVDETSVTALAELGWSCSQARCGLRAAGGDLDRAHHYLLERRTKREQAREAHRTEREARAFGICMDGSPVNPQRVEGLVSMGFTKKLATVALRNSNNHVAEAVRLIQEQPELLVDSDISSDDTDTPSSEDSTIEPDNKLVAELEAMGYPAEEAKTALRLARNHISGAVDILVKGQLLLGQNCTDESNPSTSSGHVSSRKSKKRARKLKKKERDQALKRLRKAIKAEEDEHLDSSLNEEEEFLVQYKSLL